MAPEARGYAEVMRVSTGEETATGLGLAFGPKLLDDPLLLEHIAHERARSWDRFMVPWPFATLHVWAIRLDPPPDGSWDDGLAALTDALTRSPPK